MSIVTLLVHWNNCPLCIISTHVTKICIYVHEHWIRLEIVTLWCVHVWASTFTTKRLANMQHIAHLLACGLHRQKKTYKKAHGHSVTSSWDTVPPNTLNRMGSAPNYVQPIMQFLFSGKTSVLTKLRFSYTAVPARSANPLQPAGVLPCQSDASKKKRKEKQSKS